MIVHICIAYFFQLYPKNATFCVMGTKVHQNSELFLYNNVIGLSQSPHNS